MQSVISIVMPTYGRDAVLVDSIRALLALAAPADELLVVDQTPAHDEKTSERLTGWNQSGDIRWIRQQPPGVVGAMNRGLREAQGDIVLFLDDDIVPDANLVAGHRQAHIEHPESWAVVGRVLQPENRQMDECINREFSELGEDSLQAVNPSSLIRVIRKIRGSLSSESLLRQDLDFKFNGTEPVWVENVMAGNLSVRREKALALGGFDENFIPPVSFRFETEFAKRIIAAGGRVRFDPAALIRHLRAPQGGTRSLGSHLTSSSPLHGVGDYYYALRCGKGWERLIYILRRPFREVCTNYHLRHPWWIPLKFIGELRALVLAFQLHRAGTKRIATSEGVGAFYNAQYAGSRYASYAEPALHPFYKQLNMILDKYGCRSGKWLEVGCGRGFLQDVVVDYTGLDVSSTVASFLHKPFCCASAEALPFEDGIFDGLWSYAVLEHVEDPGQALLEIRRVLKPGGILFLAPAWQCRPWATRDYAWKPWRDLSLPDRLRKALIPIRESVMFRACSLFPRRLFHLLLYDLKNAPIRFYSRPLTPNYSEYKVIDADARHHMDPFDAILWFRSRGDRVLSHPGWRKQFFVRSGVLVIERAAKC